MADYRVQTPVVMIIFRRPETTARVFAQVAKAKPKKLLVVADGPRKEKQGERERCVATRAIIDRVDWDCEVLKNYSDDNLGLRTRVTTGLDWVFDTVDRAIILEDDIAPHDSFFRFCDELLQKYADDPRIGSIGGSNLLRGARSSPYSYYFARLHNIWGWATWARAWQLYDPRMDLWPMIRDCGYLRLIHWNGYGFFHWQEELERVYRGELDSWALPWNLSCWEHSMMAIIPTVNLIDNIGFGVGASHYKTVPGFANLPTEAVQFPLTHPPHLMPDEIADTLTGQELGLIPRTGTLPDKLRKARMRLRIMLRTVRGSVQTALGLIRDGEFGEVVARLRSKFINRRL